MRTPAPRAPVMLALALTLMVIPGPTPSARAQGQPAGEQPLTFELGTPTASGGIDQVEPDGRVRLKINVRGPAPGLATGVSEGLYLLFSGLSNPERTLVSRLTVEDVPSKDVVAGRVDAQAAARLRVGEAVVLMRPWGSTTAQLKAVPEFVKVQRGEPPAGALPEGTAEAFRAARMDARMAAARTRSVNNLKQIGLALHNFHSANDHFPPAVVRGPDGKPWHSWRVLLLPYLEQVKLYNAYRFDEPWDGPNNRKLLDQMPDIYHEPAYPGAKGHDTNYAVVVGQDTVFPPQGLTMTQPPNIPDRGPGARGMADITDGTSNTIGVVPVSPEKKIPWTKPEDLAFPENDPKAGVPEGITWPYEVDGPAGKVKLAPVLFLDGSVRTISEKVHALVLRAALTSRGGEVISSDAFSAGLPPGVPGRGSPPTTTLTIIRQHGQASGYMSGP